MIIWLNSPRFVHYGITFFRERQRSPVFRNWQMSTVCVLPFVSLFIPHRHRRRLGRHNHPNNCVAWTLFRARRAVVRIMFVRSASQPARRTRTLTTKWRQFWVALRGGGRSVGPLSTHHMPAKPLLMVCENFQALKIYMINFGTRCECSCGWPVTWSPEYGIWD